MTGTTSPQNDLIERILVAADDSSISVVAFFEGLPTGYFVTNPIRTNGVLEFVSMDGSTVRVREDMIIGIVEHAR